MNTSDIVEALDSEISRLRQVRDLLDEQENDGTGQQIFQARRTDLDEAAPKRRGRPPGSKSKAETIAPEQPTLRRAGLSPAAKERIAAAQRARWAKQKSAEKKAHRSATKAASDQGARVRASKPVSAKKTLPAATSKRFQPLKKVAVIKKANRATPTKRSRAIRKAAPAGLSEKAAGAKKSAPTKSPTKSSLPHQLVSRGQAGKQIELSPAAVSAAPMSVDAAASPTHAVSENVSVDS